MDPTCLVSRVRAGAGGVAVSGRIPCLFTGPLIPVKRCLKATAFFFSYWRYPLSEPLYFTITMHDVTKQESQTASMNMMSFACFNVLSPAPNPIQHLGDVGEEEMNSMNVQLTNLQQVDHAIMPT